MRLRALSLGHIAFEVETFDAVFGVRAHGDSLGEGTEEFAFAVVSYGNLALFARLDGSVFELGNCASAGGYCLMDDEGSGAFVGESVFASLDAVGFAELSEVDGVCFEYYFCLFLRHGCGGAESHCDGK